jgi:chromosome segregation ATPase
MSGPPEKREESWTYIFLCKSYDDLFELVLVQQAQLSELSELYCANDDLASQVKVLSIKNDDQEEAVRRAESRAEDVEATLGGVVETNDGLQSRNEQLQNEYNELRQNYDTVEVELGEAYDQIDELKRQVKALQAAPATEGEKLKTIVQDLDKYPEDLADDTSDLHFDQTRDSHENHYERWLETNKKILPPKSEQLLKDNIECGRKLECSEEKLQQCNEERLGLKEQLEKAREQNMHLRSHAVAIERAMSAARKSGHKIEGVDDGFEVLHEEWCEAKSALRKSQAKNEDCDNKCQALRKQLEDTERALQDAKMATGKNGECEKKCLALRMKLTRVAKAIEEHGEAVRLVVWEEMEGVECGESDQRSPEQMEE